MTALLHVPLFVLLGAGPPLAGGWALDPYLSDHPEQVARLLRLSSGQLHPDDVPVEAIDRGEFPRGRQPFQEPMRGGDQQVFDELCESVQYPPRRITITEEAGSITIADAIGEAVTFTTGGAAETVALRHGTVTRRVRREGPRLVVAYALERGGTLEYRYEIAPTTGQLVVRVTFARRAGTALPFEIKLIYNRDASPGGP